MGAMHNVQHSLEVIERNSLASIMRIESDPDAMSYLGYGKYVHSYGPALLDAILRQARELEHEATNRLTHLRGS